MFDLLVINFLYDFVRGGEVLVRLVIFLAVYLPWLLGLVAILSILQKRSLSLLYMFGATFFGSWVLSEILKYIIGRPRPYVLFTRIKPLFFVGDTLAMPSVHTLVLSSIALFIFTFNRRLGLFLWILVLCVGLGRIASGVHWPSDVLMGLVLGTIFGLWPLFLPKINLFLKDLLIKTKSL